MSVCLRLQLLSDRMDMAGILDEPLPISRAEVLPFLQEIPGVKALEHTVSEVLNGGYALTYCGRKVVIL